MDKKLTDKEIVKALECCTKREHQCCNDGECPLFYKTVTYSECRWKLLKETTDLINRLQARIGIYETCNARKDEAIKHLEAENENYSKNNQQMTSDILKLYKELEQAKAENERLEHQFETLCLALKLAKAEAYKEFAYELMQIPNVTVYKWEIKNLLKEKVGEK